MTIRKTAILQACLLLAGLLALLMTSQMALQRLKVNGPVYHDIVRNKDLVADILPPPKYIIEPYLEATLALQDPKSADARAKRLAVLKGEYDTRQKFWVAESFDGDLKSLLTDKSHAPAQRFWNTLSAKFLPALKQGDMAAAQAAYGELSAAYAEHRAKVDELVTAANARIEKAEADARADDAATMKKVWLASGFMLALLISAIVGILRMVVDPIERMTGAMTTLARGNLDVEVPYLDRHDEIGGMAHAMLVFKDAVAVKRIADEQTTAEARAAAHREIQEMEAWIARENPSVQEVERRAAEFRARHMTRVKTA